MTPRCTSRPKNFGISSTSGAPRWSLPSPEGKQAEGPVPQPLRGFSLPFSLSSQTVGLSVHLAFKKTFIALELCRLPRPAPVGGNFSLPGSLQTGGFPGGVCSLDRLNFFSRAQISLQRERTPSPCREFRCSDLWQTGSWFCCCCVFVCFILCSGGKT